MVSLQAQNDRFNPARTPRVHLRARNLPCRALVGIALLLLLAAGTSSTEPVMSAVQAICEAFGRSLDAAAAQLAGRLLGQPV